MSRRVHAVAWRLAMAGLIVALAGCAAGPGLESSEGDGASAREVRTASDVGDAERRARVRLELASGYFARGQNATALDEVKVALAASPELHEAYNLRGLIYAAMGETALAEGSFRRALQLDARDPDTLHNYGWFQCQQGRFAEAYRLFEQALAAPQYVGVARTTFARGVCLAREGRWDDAERQLSRSYELDPSSPATAYNLAEVLLRRGELERARFYVARINAVPEQRNAQSLWLAARIEHRAGNLSAARDFGRQLRDRHPQSLEALQFERGRFDGP